MSPLKIVIADCAIVVFRGSQFVMSVPFSGRKSQKKSSEWTFWTHRRGNPRDTQELLHILEYSFYEERNLEVSDQLIQVIGELSLDLDRHSREAWKVAQAA